jgi:hypothetical protein
VTILTERDSIPIQCIATEGAMNRKLNIAGIVLLLYGAGQTFYSRDTPILVTVACIIVGAVLCLIGTITRKA